jgi:predicted transcriptional regulator
MFANNPQELAENKLLLLYILSQTEFSLTNAKLTQFILENDIMNYFMLQQYLSELKEADFIAETQNAIGQNTLCQMITLTEKGRNALDYFVNRIPSDQKNTIDAILSMENNKSLQHSQIKAEYIKLENNEYSVVLSIMEDMKSLVHLSLNVQSEKQAKEMCQNWNKKAGEVYGNIMYLLKS